MEVLPFIPHICISQEHIFGQMICVTTPLLEECENDIHIPKMGTWEFFRTPKTSKFDCRGQNTLP
jgi:hypothetical protein